MLHRGNNETVSVDGTSLQEEKKDSFYVYACMTRVSVPRPISLHEGGREYRNQCARQLT